jgi:hypothetical protein
LGVAYCSTQNFAVRSNSGLFSKYILATCASVCIFHIRMSLIGRQTIINYS